MQKYVDTHAYTGIDVFQVQVTKMQAIHLNFFFALTNNQSALYLSTGNWPWCSVDMYILVVGWKWVADMEEKREMDGDRKGGGGTTRRASKWTRNTGAKRRERKGMERGTRMYQKLDSRSEEAPWPGHVDGPCLQLP